MWYHLFCETPPATTDADSNDTPILAPLEPALAPEEEHCIPYSIPSFMFMLLGPKAKHKDKDLANKACLLVSSGCRIIPPSSTQSTALCSY